jgi:hypothetical protein
MGSILLRVEDSYSSSFIKDAGLTVSLNIEEQPLGLSGIKLPKGELFSLSSEN